MKQVSNWLIDWAVFLAFCIPSLLLALSVSRYFPSILRSLFCGPMEPRSANKQAIDMLLPNLISKDRDNATLVCSFLRKTIIEDSTNLGQISIIFQAIVRHRQLFYPYRQSFLTLMWQNVQKMGLASSAADQKRTTVDILDCIFYWEAMRKGIEV